MNIILFNLAIRTIKTILKMVRIIIVRKPFFLSTVLLNIILATSIAKHYEYLQQDPMIQKFLMLQKEVLNAKEIIIDQFWSYYVLFYLNFICNRKGRHQYQAIMQLHQKIMKQYHESQAQLKAIVTINLEKKKISQLIDSYQQAVLALQKFNHYLCDVKHSIQNKYDWMVQQISIKQKYFWRVKPTIINDTNYDQLVTSLQNFNNFNITYEMNLSATKDSLITQLLKKAFFVDRYYHTDYLQQIIDHNVIPIKNQTILVQTIEWLQVNEKIIFFQHTDNWALLELKTLQPNTTTSENYTIQYLLNKINCQVHNKMFNSSFNVLSSCFNYANEILKQVDKLINVTNNVTR